MGTCTKKLSLIALAMRALLLAETQTGRLPLDKTKPFLKGFETQIFQKTIK